MRRRAWFSAVVVVAVLVWEWPAYFTVPARTPEEERCLAEGNFRHEGNFRYISFSNTCALEAPVRVCGIYDSRGRDTAVSGENVPPRGNKEVQLVDSKGRPLVRYVWIEGTQNPCPPPK